VLGGGDGDSFTYGAGASGAASVAELTFSGADAGVTLQANELYAVQIDPTALPASYWVRDGVMVLNVEAYRMNQFSAGNMGALNGTDQRDFGLAVTVATVPEPASMTLMGLGILAGGILIRRRQKA
jgi:hypothetical protein